MSERDDYLWDPTAVPDRQVQDLERVLSPLRHDGRGLPLQRLQRRRQRRLLPLVAAAVLAAAIWLLLRSGTGLAAVELSPGAPSRWLVAADRVQPVRLGALAVVELLPASELYFAHWGDDEVRFSLRRGALRAQVAPPPAVQPRFFVVETARGEVIDLGCRYELTLREGSIVHVRVIEGAVEFAGDRRVFVPAGAALLVGRDGPGTPVFEDASAELRQLAAKFDAATAPELAQDRRQIGERLIATARTGRDTLVLYHLLLHADPSLRDRAELRLLDLVGPPPGVDPPPGKEPQPLRADPGLWLGFLRGSVW